MPDWFGPALIVFVLVIALPVGVLISGAAGAAILGAFTQKAVERDHEDSEFLELGQTG